MTHEITLIDAGTGNLRSVHKALESLGANVNLTPDPEQVLLGGTPGQKGPGSGENAGEQVPTGTYAAERA